MPNPAKRFSGSLTKKNHRPCTATRSSKFTVWDKHSHPPSLIPIHLESHASTSMSPPLHRATMKTFAFFWFGGSLLLIGFSLAKIFPSIYLARLFADSDGLSHLFEELLKTSQWHIASSMLGGGLLYILYFFAIKFRSSLIPNRFLVSLSRTIPLLGFFWRHWFNGWFSTMFLISLMRPAIGFKPTSLSQDMSRSKPRHALKHFSNTM